MQRRSLKGNICPVARSLEDIGDWWTLLIVRDAQLGVRRFSDFQRRLGMARNVLSARLKKMVGCGILEMAPAADGTAYQEYVLTEKGRALLPVLIALRQWGEQYLFAEGEPHSLLLEKASGHPLPMLTVVGEGGEALQPEDLTLQMPGDNGFELPRPSVGDGS